MNVCWNKTKGGKKAFFIDRALVFLNVFENNLKVDTTHWDKFRIIKV
jgi:hypothetical protein